MGIGLTMLILFITEITHSEFIITYKNDIQKNIDLFSSFIMNGILIYMMVVYI